MAKTGKKRPLRKLSKSQEDYLEAIHDLFAEGNAARVRDIANRLGVGMSSVSAALKALAERGLVNYDPYQLVTLTPEGQKLAETVAGRHETLQRFFTEVLGLDADAADANACRAEHAIDEQALQKLRRFVAAADEAPPAVRTWLDAQQSDG